MVDSCAEPAEKKQSLKRGILMADENNLAPVIVVGGAGHEVDPPRPVKKGKSLGGQKAGVKPVLAEPGPLAAAPRSASARSFNAQERSEKLASISLQVRDGKSTLKAAVKSVGISEQTYYNWKRTSIPGINTDTGPDTAVGELADLIQLEQENLSLRKNLAEKLRLENAELRKKLGLD
jgi:putative transposase